MIKRILSCTLPAIIVAASAVSVVSAVDDVRDGVDFQVLLTKPAYAPRSNLTVKFIVTNSGTQPFYLSRGLNECSSPLGFAFFQILDQRNNDVRTSGCSADIVRLADADVAEEVTEPMSWIKLAPGEIYGGEARFRLPAKKGTYRLKAELVPPSFTDQQKEKLSTKKIRILHSGYFAPVVTITIK